MSAIVAVEEFSVNHARMYPSAKRILKTLDGRRFESNLNLHVASEMTDDEISMVISAMNSSKEKLAEQLKLVVAQEYWDVA
jgi:hypothetical protein